MLRLSERLTLLPVVHGSGDYAVAVRKRLLESPVDCLAVPLPGTFAPDVLTAAEKLPTISVVTQLESEEGGASYVPIDPCQPVIAAIRWARSERVPIAWIDLERWRNEPTYAVLPDPYALKGLDIEQYALAVLPSLTRPEAESPQDLRVRRMAFELHRLELDHAHVVALVSIVDWPWIREAYLERRDYPEHESYFAPIHIHPVEPVTLSFVLGELPAITAMYEATRATLDSDEQLSIDGIKAILLDARQRWKAKRSGEQNWVTPKLLQVYLQYVRNLTLSERRLSPDLYTLVVAAKQIVGDGFAREVLEASRAYPIGMPHPPGAIRMGIDEADLPEAGVVAMKTRLPGIPRLWRACDLLPEPPPRDERRWQMNWNPYRQCSWPPEDDRIESFHAHVREQAMALIGSDLARTEKFTSSVKDGIDIRETLRHAYEGSIYVREIPPSRGGIDAVVFLFDVPADPDRYPWRTTWLAEHKEESTLVLFATDFRREMVGPGIGRARYGGVLFLFPPRMIDDVWEDPSFNVPMPLEDRLIHAAVIHSRDRHVAVVSPGPLRSSWRQWARRFGKRLIHLPLSRFSGQTVDRLRTVHVLNGREVRSYAARFIRDK